MGGRKNRIEGRRKGGKRGRNRRKKGKEGEKEKMNGSKAEMRGFLLFDSSVTDQRTDGPTNRPTDGQSLL